MTAESTTRATRSIGKSIDGALSAFFNALIGITDIFFSLVQRVVGLRGMPYIFVLPNLLIFSIFILFPMLLTFFYSFAGGIEFFPGDRPWVRTTNFE